VYQGGTDHGGKQIYVGNFDCGTKQEELRQMFSDVRSLRRPSVGRVSEAAHV
jgi:hypothetical protein